jgi:uncharacterized protein with HEPN domain
MKDEQALLIDIVEHARHVRAALSRLTRPEYDASVLARMGMTHLLQIIGEASRLLPDSARLRFPTVPWNQIVGMRHRIVHEYFRIDFDLIWDTANVSVVELLAALEPEVGPIIDQQRPQADQS